MNNIAFTSYDLVVLGIIGISVLFGLIRGFVKEAFSLIFFILALYLAGKFYSIAIDYLLKYVSLTHTVQVILAFVIVFLSVLIIGKLIASLLSKLLSSVGLSLFDRLLGGLFGAFRGVLMVVILSALFALTELPKSNEWKDALTRPAIETLVGTIRHWLPENWADQLLNATDIRLSK